MSKFIWSLPASDLLLIWGRIFPRIMGSIWINEASALHIDEAAFLQNPKAEILKSDELTKHGRAVKIDDKLEIDVEKGLCYDYILTNRGLTLPLPRKPLDTNEIYDMYVVRRLSEVPIRIPGLKQRAASTPGTSIALNSRGSGASEEPSVVDSTDCQPRDFVIQTIRDRTLERVRQTRAAANAAQRAAAADPIQSTPKARTATATAAAQQAQKDADAAADALDQQWFLPGKTFQQIQLALPRILAAIWSTPNLTKTIHDKIHQPGRKTNEVLLAEGIQAFEKYLRDQSELAFHPNMKLDVSKKTPGIVIHNKGLTLPFPKRKTREELYESWARGKSAIPSFTDTTP